LLTGLALPPIRLHVDLPTKDLSVTGVGHDLLGRHGRVVRHDLQGPEARDTPGDACLAVRVGEPGHGGRRDVQREADRVPQQRGRQVARRNVDEDARPQEDLPVRRRVDEFGRHVVGRRVIVGPGLLGDPLGGRGLEVVHVEEGLEGRRRVWAPPSALFVCAILAASPLSLRLLQPVQARRIDGPELGLGLEMLLERAGRVDGIVLLGCVAPRQPKDDPGAARMGSNKIRHIVHMAVQYHPAALRRIVPRDCSGSAFWVRIPPPSHGQVVQTFFGNESLRHGANGRI